MPSMLRNLRKKRKKEKIQSEELLRLRAEAMSDKQTATAYP